MTTRAEAERLYDEAFNARSDLLRQVRAADDAVIAARRKLADIIAEEMGVKVGDERTHRGKRYSVSSWAYYGYDNEPLIFKGRAILKDGSLGKVERRLW